MTALLTGICQGVCVAWATALVIRVTPGLSAASRHRVWWSALAVVVALPFGYTFDVVSTNPTAPGLMAGTRLVADAGASAWVVQVPSPPDWLLFGIGLIWFSSCCVGIARLLIAVRAVQRLKRHSAPLDLVVEEQLPIWKVARHEGRRPLLHHSPHVPTACAAGLFGRPTIVVSDALVASLSPGDLDRLVMHEHAHLARYDDWTALVQAAVSAIGALHPAINFISRRIDREREAACDDQVVGRCGNAWRYARCLAEAADIAARSAGRNALPPRIALAAFRQKDALLSRIGRLVEDRPRGESPRRFRRVAGTAGSCALATAACVAIAAMPPFVVDQPEIGLPAVSPALLRGQYDLARVDHRRIRGDRHPVPTVLTDAHAGSAAGLLPLRERDRRARVDSRGGVLTASPSGPARAIATQTAPSTGFVDNAPARQPSDAASDTVALVGQAPAARAEIVGHVLSPLPSREIGPEATSGVFPPVDVPRVGEGAPSPQPAQTGPGAAGHASLLFEPPGASGSTGWSAVGDRSVALGLDLARAGSSSGTAARDAGVAVAGFFSRMGKRIGARVSGSP